MSIKKVAVDHAIGMTLGHDVSHVNVTSRKKGVAFKRGHIIQEKDIPVFRYLGKRHVFVWTDGSSEIHEDDVARQVAPMVAGRYIYYDREPVEGKVGFYAKINGVFKVDVPRLKRINALAVPSLPTIHSNFPVHRDKQVAAFRIIPLCCDKEIYENLLAELEEPLFEVIPYKIKKAAIFATGCEVYEGLVTDDFSPRIARKLRTFGIDVREKRVLPDACDTISNAITRAAEKCGLLILTGGTSVDPDDVTVMAMNKAGVLFPQKGNPIQPGNNLTIGYIPATGTAVCAVPAAALFYDITALDVFLPRIVSGERIPPEEISSFGHGGLCHFCSHCTYPICPFGKCG